MISNRVREMIDLELRDARVKFAPMNSTHEGYAVILEELEETWELIKANRPHEEILPEAVQLAAMTVRLIEDVLLEAPRWTCVGCDSTFDATWEVCPVCNRERKERG